MAALVALGMLVTALHDVSQAWDSGYYHLPFAARLVGLLPADGFVFHTNYHGRKGRELLAHPEAALLFYWEARGRQVRIEGAIHKTSDEESDAYFVTRPHGGQIGAHASYQSRVITSREELDERVSALEAEFEGHPVPRPPWWGGLRLRPQTFEFWQNREDRLHDRLRYTPGDAGWQIDRLQP